MRLYLASILMLDAEEEVYCRKLMPAMLHKLDQILRILPGVKVDILGASRIDIRKRFAIMIFENFLHSHLFEDRLEVHL